MSLASLPRLLRDEPALTQAIGNPTASSPCPRRRDPSRIAALAAPQRPPSARGRVPHRHRGRAAVRRPAPVPAPTARWCCSPAWETLPFERVSPSVETMGRRLEVLWRLRTMPSGCRGDRRAPACASLLQRLGPGADEVEPVVRRAPATSIDPAELLAAAGGQPATAARTRSSTAARSPAAARSSTCSRPPPTRRSASTCGATRSTGSPSSP